MATPSVNGLRFLPVSALTAFLWVADHSGRKAADFPFGIGHFFWGLCALWSVESAFYATCVCWPYYLMLQRSLSKAPFLQMLLRSSCVLLALPIAFAVFFLSDYWLIYQTMPTASGIFAYIVNPPGPLPINFSGAIWFFVAVISAGTWANVQTFRCKGNTADLRRGVALSLLAYSTFTYFLGRSHDNNILNLMPFLLLVLLHAQSHAAVTAAGLHKGFTSGLLAGLLGWMGIFGWNAWVSGFQTSYLSWLDSNWASRVMVGDGRGQEGFFAATQRVIAQAQAVFPDPVTVAGPTNNLSTTDAKAVWSALHSPANIYMFTPEVRRDFLRKTANTLQRSGWLLVWKNEPIALGLVPDFDAVYSRTYSFEKSGYLAIHYMPVQRPVSSQAAND